MDIFGRNKIVAEVGVQSEDVVKQHKSIQTWIVESTEKDRRLFSAEFHEQILNLLIESMLPDDIAVSRAKIALRNMINIGFEDKRSSKDIAAEQLNWVQRILGAQACLTDPLPISHSTPAPRKIAKAKKRIRSSSDSECKPVAKKQDCSIM